ncbi:MAG: hemolysin III family protein [Gammaproteobacteria bacterium]|nr:hemolysin III family protein [Gammaproteobacteria bacterium]
MANGETREHIRASLYSLKEEVANSVTHGLGAVASIVGLAVLVGFAAVNGDAQDVTAVSIFGASMILLYTSSTLYHSVPHDGARAVFKVMDHASIYLLIAGTYTPYTLISLRGEQGWELFAIIWTLAAVGVVFKLFFTGKFDKLSTVIYLAMGWLVVFYGKSVMEAVPAGGMWLLLAGGLSYTVGVVFYVWDKLPFNHAIWHVFVLGGTVCHYLSILLYVVPDSPAQPLVDPAVIKEAIQTIKPN